MMERTTGLIDLADRLVIVVRAVEIKSMMANYLTVREHVDYKQEGSKHHGVPPNGEIHGGQGRSWTLLLL